MSTNRKLFNPDLEKLEKSVFDHNGNMSAICRDFGIARPTLYNYLKKNDKAQKIMDSVLSYNDEVDLDIAEYVQRYQMLNYKENGRLALSAAKFVLEKKGKKRGWYNETSAIVSPHQAQHDKEHEYFNLQAELVKSREIIRYFEEKYGEKACVLPDLNENEDDNPYHNNSLLDNQNDGINEDQ